MRVVLKVLGGKNDGREIVIGTPEFIIGRGDDAQLRPSSDLISRNHCLIRLSEGKVVIEDMGSRNGTFVNGQALTGPHEAKAGDNLRVGRLQFEVIIDHVRPGNKKPKVADVAEAATRTVKADKFESIEDSITDWLVDDDVEEHVKNTETVQFNLDDTKTLDIEAGDETVDSDSSKTDSSDDIGDKKKKKREFGKLPPKPKFSHDNSTAAAGDVLKKFFNRR